MTPVVRTLLLVTVGAFFLQQTVAEVNYWLTFYPPLVLTRPWTLVTYMFLHGSITHLLFNMLGLYFFGSRVEARLGERRFLTLYFLSGIAGALLSLAFQGRAGVIGASGAVYGVMLAFAFYWPDEPIHIWGIIPVPARILVIVTTVITLWSGFGGRGGGVAHFAHLGGYVGAYLYLKWLERSRTSFQRRVATASPEVTRTVRGYQRIDRSRIHEVNREEVDRILDKISANGVGSLTAQERLFLSNFVPPDDRTPPVS
ncbi:rhomboid family intramembrane serine protease [Roseisolibacter sp. H3M3-2]|uniref:rhomboid family protein n=1 Tax=Roseisolibacter sp. H3M3-2 TaxID=3031323 RepID=UPI0023DB1717|nr:rhomboid family intramembrane serine protease [Roseisolibacter sp. H3M3-2]MDF1503769.1 rhomboid family intramembrane serine protease [Roseisolibacter sp. H3M3-2]